MDQRPTYEGLANQVKVLQKENKELRKAKQAIEASEAFHRSTLENISDTVIITDDFGKIVYACPNTYTIFGLSQNQVYKKETIHELINGKACDVSELKKKQEISNIEWSVIDSAGQEKFTLINAKVVSLRGGTILYVIREITDRKQSEIKLSTAKKQWEETFNAIWDWVSIIDKDHIIIRSNSASESIVDLTPNQLVGRRCYEIVHGTNCPISDCPGKRAFKSKQRESMELQLEDGRWVRVTVDPIGGNPDGPARFVHVVRDISDVKKREQDFVSARKSEAFSLLSGGIAHDYNNLLSIIMGNISLLRDELTDSFHQQFLDEADRACELSKNLTHQFLTLSNGWFMNKSSCDLKTILQSAVDEVLQNRQLTVSMDIDSPHTTMEVDRTKLQIAFHNIILNAAEAMTKNGKLCIQVALTSKFCGMGDGKSGIQIVFADTGKGIDPDDTSKIFDPYFSSKQLGIQKGRGLGLSVAKAVITKHGGEITVESVAKKGTTVSVYLPHSTFKTDTVSKQIQSLPPGKPVTLLMEDEPPLQKLCKRMLEGSGFGVLVASTAKEAFSLFEHAAQKDIAIELLIFDQAVPGAMGGAETLKKFRISGFHGKAVLVTGSPNRPEATDYQAYGFDGRILKPYSKNDIEQVIEAVLTR